MGLVLLIALATNAVRRRRAKKFDEEVAAAAAEAAASPRYPFDDYDDAPAGAYGGGGGSGSGKSAEGRAGGAYSDPESHGTYSQPAMPLSDNYNMSEFSRYGPMAGYAAGAAGMGMAAGAGMANVRQRNDTGVSDYNPGIAGFGATTARSGSPPNPNAQAPYSAFAVPGAPAPGEMYDPTPGLQRRATNGRMVGDNPFEAAPYVAAGAHLNRGPSQHQQSSLARQPSQPSSAYTSDYSSGYAQQMTSSHGHESYAAHYQPDFRPNALPNPHSPAPPMPKNAPSQEEIGDDEAYGVDSYYPVRPSVPQEDSRMSLRDEVDYGRAPRTLKVCNPACSDKIVLSLITFDWHLTFLTFLQVANE